MLFIAGGSDAHGAELPRAAGAARADRQTTVVIVPGGGHDLTGDETYRRVLCDWVVELPMTGMKPGGTPPGIRRP